jgi:hypothetical protein
VAKVICPHCGAENPKSPIVTTCQKCLQPLESAQPAPETPTAAPAEPERLSTPPDAASTVEVPSETTTPPEPAVAPPAWQPPPSVELPPPEPAGPPPTAPVPPAGTPLPPVVEPRLPPQPAAPSAPTGDAVVREFKRGFGRGAQPRGCWIGAAVGVPVVVFMTVVAGILASRLGWGAFFPVLFIAIVVIAIGVVVAVLVGRAYIAASFYDLQVDPAPAQIGLGDTFAWGVVVRAKRPLTVETVIVILKCQEHAIARGGTSDSHYRETLHEDWFRVPGRPLRPGEQVAFRADVAIPADATPSHHSRNNFIEWTLEVRAPVPGYCPDIRDTVNLAVQPTVSAAATAGLPDDPEVPAGWLEVTPVRGEQPQLGRAWGALQAQDGATAGQAPAMAVGATRQLYLWVQTQEEVGCRGVWLWVGCRIHGRGTDEEIELIREHQVHEGPLVPGQPVGCPIQVTAPASGPVSFVGRYVKLEWVARVRFDIPMWFDKRMWVPFIVTPRRLPERGQD